MDLLKTIQGQLEQLGLSDEAVACKTIRQLPTAALLAETMRRISEEESVSSMYVD